MAIVKHSKNLVNPTTPASDALYFVKGGADPRYRPKITTTTGVLVELDAPTMAEHAQKENFIAAGTTAQFWRGDKTWQPLDKAAVGLGNVDNTSDLNKPVSTATQTALDGKIPLTQKGAANGVVPLNASTKIDAAYLPSYVDDVLEYANLAAFPATGETGKIYIAIDTNSQYRWSGSAYIKINSGDVTEMANFFVRYDAAQTLTTGQQTTARTNIGAISQADGDGRYVRVDGASTMTGPLKISTGPATTAADAVVIFPNDYGAGKPRLAIAKTATANKWQIALWDGASTNGIINFVSSQLTWNDNLLVTTTTLNSYVQNTRAINTQHSITGGGDLTANRTLSLVGDVAAPGNNKVYGTNASGVRGWYDLPSGNDWLLTEW